MIPGLPISTTWWLRRPTLYRQALRVLWRKLGTGRGVGTGSEAAATAWCAARAVDVPTALERLNGSCCEPLERLFPEEMAAAEREAAACPVEMGGRSNLELLFSLAESIQARVAVETGVAYGWSSLALLLSLDRRHEGRLVSTDMPYPGRDNDAYVGCVVPARLRSRWTLIRRPDRDALPGVLRAAEPLDLCHYDSDKSYAGRRWAYPRLWATLRPGGIFISDDVEGTGAFREFSEERRVEPLVVASSAKKGTKYVGILVKPA